MKYVGWGLLGILLIIILLLVIAIIRTLLMPDKTSDYQPEADEKEAFRLAVKLSRMVQCDTTSHAGETEVEKYLGFDKDLEELFPFGHIQLQDSEIDWQPFQTVHQENPHFFSFFYSSFNQQIGKSICLFVKYIPCNFSSVISCTGWFNQVKLLPCSSFCLRHLRIDLYQRNIVSVQAAVFLQYICNRHWKIPLSCSFIILFYEFFA